MLEGIHDCKVSYCYGDWRYKGRTGVIELANLLPFLTECQTISFGDIAWKGKNLPSKFIGKNCICCQGQRYHECDTDVPPIVVEADNPHCCRYRLIDGKHRMMKMIDDGKTESTFYILSPRHVKITT